MIVCCWLSCVGSVYQWLFVVGCQATVASVSGCWLQAGVVSVSGRWLLVVSGNSTECGLLIVGCRCQRLFIVGCQVSVVQSAGC